VAVVLFSYGQSGRAPRGNTASVDRPRAATGVPFTASSPVPPASGVPAPAPLVDDAHAMFCLATPGLLGVVASPPTAPVAKALKGTDGILPCLATAGFPPSLTGML
jgi:hypothetical protein